MGLDRLYRHAHGTVRFAAEGGHALRMPSLLSADGIPLYHVTPTDLGFEAEVDARHYRQAAKAARRTGTRIHLLQKIGLPFWLFRNRERWGVVAGALLAVLVMAFLSRFLWVVQIDGELEHYTEAQLRSQLRDYGLREGSVLSGLDASAIEQSMMIANDDLAYIAVNFRGSTAEVIVRPRVRAEPAPGTGGQPANVVSLYDGVVRSVEVYAGIPQVQVGDTVRAGDLLIGAIVETANGRSSIKQAAGRVKVEHEETLSAAVPFTEQQLRPTGEVRRVRSLVFCGLEIPLGPTPSGEVRTEIQERQLPAFGTPLPVVLRLQKHHLLQEQEVIRTEAEAAALAEKKLTELEQTQLGQAEIRERVLTGRTEGNTFLVEAHYLVLEDAALERQFEVNQ